MKNFLPSWAIPGHEPRWDKADPALFDRTGFTRPSIRYRLLDGELRKNVEERPDDPSPYL
jgi:hypothetical protein